MGGACGTYGGRVSCTQGFDGDTCQKISLGKPSIKWKVSIKTDS